ncbi:hypothetical protein [Arthrobacter crystallopoietes]|uniref:Uncharacterized protein n=1 Tax=Crystallibacter crystallopoietes TaxID=37928 RepID=A0A1H1ANZ1_9MICC|nr:hypothetical protein [Arthrobacter crystallopoietes]AUI51453.1 hypothetical protein AC20117_12220 [Arthrobacter crystallopoietes]SDQ41387.1 hypothetical protein SAMN04489742_1021 [Arthrobacter crystallopoietes]
MIEKGNPSDAGEPTVTAVLCLPVCKGPSAMQGMKPLAMAAVICQIVAPVVGVPGVVSGLIVFALMILACLRGITLRRRSITRYETTVNETLNRDLHSNLRISYSQGSLLRAGQMISLQDGNQSFAIVMRNLDVGSETGADTEVTITAMHGDLGLSAFDGMVRAVTGR